jgi:glycosyltransferase involved in cell wall biosynthesis
MQAQKPGPWLSILIPVYNVAPYLRACVRSILSQADAGVEILLVDDGSTDDSRQLGTQLCAEHAQAMRLLLHDRNRGLSAARNTLLDVAAGRHVWFVDSDDEVLPGAIAALRSIIDAHDPDLILCSYREGERILNGFTGPEQSLSWDREALVRGVFASRRLYSWSRISRRTLWGADLRFPVGRYFEDIMTTPGLCLRVESFYYVNQPWIHYRQREDSIMAVAARAQRTFNRRMNDDLAGALTPFHVAARAALPGMSRATRRCITEFCLRTFADLGWRLVRARRREDSWGAILRELRRYRDLTEQDVPASFASAAHFPLRQLRLKLWLRVSCMLLLTAGRPRGRLMPAR